jgi:hypothetical protein
MKLFFIIFLFYLNSQAGFIGAGGNSPLEIKTEVINEWKHYNGKVIENVKMNGLVRTRLIAVEWLLKTRAGNAFSAEQLAEDLQSLYNTGDLYDVAAEVQELNNKVNITVNLKDKWTLLPVIGAQGGGGSVTVGGGLYDSNIAGLFITGQVLWYNFNGIFSYDVNFNQEYIAGTQTMGYIDWSNNVNPTPVHLVNGTSVGDFTWQRQQEEIMIGTHLDGLIRPMLVMDYFFDGLSSINGVSASVFYGSQYRLNPRIIFGKVNITNYLEEGSEFTVQGSTYNPFGPVTNYQSFELDYKKVYVISRNNLGYFLSAAAMTMTPPPYEYEVGGYYNLRGFADSREVGPYSLHGNIEYRPYITEGRWKFFDVDLVVLQSCIFTDFGSAWGDSTLTGDPSAKQANFLWSAGVGLRANFVKFAGAILRLDVARTIRPDEGIGVSFGIGQFF